MMSNMVHCTVLNRLSVLRMLEASAKFAYLPNSRVQKLARGAQLTTERYFAGRNVEYEHFDTATTKNEQMLKYMTGSDERVEVKKAISEVMHSVENVPIIIDGKEVYGKLDLAQTIPHNTSQCIARYDHATPEIIELAITRATRAQIQWDNTPICERMHIWDTAANLIAKNYRFKIIAALMLGQGKTLYQAEMDVAELVDFMRFNSMFLRSLANYKPVNDCPTLYRNHVMLRGLKGFVAAISPFNYASIAGNLAYTPALMGNAVLWKPSDSSILSSWYVFKAMHEAGVPDGVVNFVPALPECFANVITKSSKLAGIHFTGTTDVLKSLWRKVAHNINVYDNYPRLVGDSGGKNFHFVHPSANPDIVVACTIRAAFEYAGQKCSSCSMLYVPESLWESQIKQPLLNKTSKLFISEATFSDCFFSAVINKDAYKRIFDNLRYIHSKSYFKVLFGGTCIMNRGHYVDPTIVLVDNLDDALCKEELLAPILCVYVYKDHNLKQIMQKVTEINHGLTGSVFADDDIFIQEACQTFKANVGNLNINDKCTGSMVGQQPFGAGQMSGTNEKLGSPQYLLRWTSPLIIKESFVPHVKVYHPYMELDEEPTENTKQVATVKELLDTSFVPEITTN